MKQFNVILIFAGLALSVTSLWAVEIHVCEDEAGNQTFQKFCPPGSKSLSTKEYSARNAENIDGTSLPEVVLYAVPDCDICDQVREHLSASNIRITEKNIKDNGELQQELKSKTGGDLRVPVLLVGEKVVAGYDRENLSAVLREAGYITELSKE